MKEMPGQRQQFNFNQTMADIMRSITAILFLTLFLSLPALGSFVLLDRIAAIVDEDVIMQSEVDARIQQVLAQLAADPAAEMPPEDLIRDQVLERLIVEDLQMQMGERAGVRVSDDQLNAALQRIAAQNNLSLIQFRAAIEQDGISYASMREQIRKEMIISQVQQGVMNSRIEISDQELKNFLASEVGETITADEYRLAHILLAIPDQATPEQVHDVKSRADTLLGRLDRGENFQSIAIAESSGQDATNGGDLGWRKPVQLPTMFADVAQDMIIGEVRGPIRSGSGFHLIKLMEKRGAAAEGQVPQTRVRHVLIKPSEIRTDLEARELAESLREEVIGGRDFDELAKLYSEDPGSALSGGDLGWERAGVYVDTFEQHIANSAIDEISPVFKTEHGYHFLQVRGRRIEDFSETFRRSQAENYLRNQKFDEELENWLREIREEAFVDIRL
jgi:peptidyl-prolyl cis-trans isomerase SurA